MLYLELGCIPIRELISKRRILFLHYIMNESESSMINRFFKTQLRSKKPKDWISSVLKDLKDLKMEETIEEIQVMRKTMLKRIVNKAIARKAFERLICIKENHSKVKHLIYSNLKMQNYLKPSRVKVSQKEMNTIFEMRSRVTKVKVNFRGNYENLECRICKNEEESQTHVYDCEELRKMRKFQGKKVEYEKLYGENVRLQKEIANYFTENMKILSQME